MAHAEALDQELENVLRHLIGRAQELSTEEDALLGAGAQLVFATSGVRYISLKSEMDHRVQELVVAKSLLRVARAQCPPEVQQALAEAEALIDRAQSMSSATPQTN